MDPSFSFLRKALAGLVAGLTGAATFLLIGNGGGIRWFPPAVVFPLVGLAVLAGILLPLWWQWRKPAPATSQRIYAVLLASIRYLTAFNVASFGWKKLFGLQFIVPPAIASQPINQLSGEWLTWFYFGYSPAYGLLIAGIQLLGASLLLFRRTTLLGAVVLGTVLLNLSLINIFYHLNAGALVQSLVATLDVLFLLGLHYKQLTRFFLAATTPLLSSPPPRTWATPWLKFSAIALSLLFTIYLRMLFKGH